MDISWWANGTRPAFHLPPSPTLSEVWKLSTPKEGYSNLPSQSLLDQTLQQRGF